MRGKCLHIKPQSVKVYLHLVVKARQWESMGLSRAKDREQNVNTGGIDSYLCFLVHAQCTERVVHASRGWDFVGRRGDSMRYW